jgi:hypothetical protein
MIYSNRLSWLKWFSNQTGPDFTARSLIMTDEYSHHGKLMGRWQCKSHVNLTSPLTQPDPSLMPSPSFPRASPVLDETTVLLSVKTASLFALQQQ